MSKFLRVCAVIAVCSLSATAQFQPSDARIDAMGGTFIIKDRSDVFRYAAYMNNYENDVQVAFKGSNGSILGIKSLGESFDIGIMGNRDQMADGNFYSVASGALAFNGIPVPAVTTNERYVPHALFGLNLGSVNLGLDGYCEVSRTKYHGDGAGITTDASLNLLDPGFIFSALFGTEDIPISGKFGMGWPRVKGEASQTGAPTAKISSDKGMQIEFGGELGLPLGSFKGTLGADDIVDNYQIKGQTTKFTNWREAYYLGISTKVFEDGVVGLMYETQWRDTITDNSSTDVIDKKGSLHQIGSLGIENNWSKVWVLDKVAARGGIRYEYSKPISKTDAATDSKTASAAYGGFSPTVGLGVTKGAFSLDLYIDLGAWTNLVNGPGVGSITGTLDF